MIHLTTLVAFLLLGTPFVPASGHLSTADDHVVASEDEDEDEDENDKGEKFLTDVEKKRLYPLDSGFNPFGPCGWSTPGLVVPADSSGTHPMEASGDLKICDGRSPNQEPPLPH